MSCSSPFTLSLGETTLTSFGSKVNYSGTALIPGYTFKSNITIPEYTCTGGWNCSCCCYKTWFLGDKYCTKYPCCGWTNFTWGYSQELWPALTFKASCSTDWSFKTTITEKFTLSPSNNEDTGAEVGQPIDEAGLPLKTALCNTVTFESTTIDVTVNGESFSFSAPSTVDVGTENGDFVVTVSFPSDYLTEGTVDYGGGTLSFSCLPYWQMCSEPTPPVGWLNLDIPITLTLTTDSESVDLWGWSYNINVGTFSTTVTIACPVISVED